MDENGFINEKEAAEQKIQKKEIPADLKEKAKTSHDQQFAFHNTVENELHAAKKSGNAKDSREMQQVKECLRNVNNALNEEMVDNFEGFKRQVIELSEEYKRLILASVRR